MSSPTHFQVAYVVSQDLIKYSSRLPSNPGRSILVHSLANAFGLLSHEFSSLRQLQLVKPKPATINDLGAYHARNYLDALLRTPDGTDSEDMSEFGLEDDCPRFPGLSEYICLVAGATITAANALRFGYADIAINWDGGRHHAQKSRASGFCYVADCVLAILLLKKTQPAPALSLSSDTTIPNATPSHRKPRVMYLDLDVHFSDGVSQAFYSPGRSSSTQVLTVSIHHAAPGFFPSSPLAQLPFDPSTSFDPFTLSLPLLEGASNSTFAAIWPLIERIKDVFKPDYVVVQCGVDGLAGDPKCKVFNWSLDVAAEGSLGWCVSRIVDDWKGIRKLFLGGGGYHAPNAARTWAYLTSIILGNPLDISISIPDDPSHSAFPLYAPSFTLDVPAGNMLDTNSKEYLAEARKSFERASEMLQEIMQAQQSQPQESQSVSCD
ncbi:histone deacetylase complex protein [Lentinula edodes]|uniref:histone deacetylase complex protein n=1 Tax=Lentinula edodes TaxID=5353 RepID=UPI001E8DD667|nr:histone deacetylase complex protein [Lentinula edodes]KAH7878388.1 histone deacetylase complex protein [Lentinula edodes]